MSRACHRQPPTRELGASREWVFPRFRLVVVAGPDQGREQASTGPELLVGSAPGNQLVLTDPAVSRHHFAITVTPKGLRLRDLDSKNGTTLGGFLIESAYLAPGALIGAGQTTLRLETLEDPVREPLAAEERFGPLVGRSEAVRRLFALLPRLAAADTTLLLEGETGTGKGLVCEAIHRAGPRAKGPFVVVDCSALPPTLIESELFGHERGAFTRAHTARPGAFELAQGGTVMLDEIGELPLDMQPKLLRVLEERTVRRLGSSSPIKLDVRVIAATNRSLHEEVKRGTFRSDLFYRLDVVRLRIPPLRERREDIPLLVAHFWEQLCGDEPGPGAAPRRPPPELIARLVVRDWPGNVRELRSAVERAVLFGDAALAEGSAVQVSPPPAAAAAPAPASTAPAGAPAAPAGSPAGAAAAPSDEASFDPTIPFRLAKERTMARWESAYLRELVRRGGANLSRAARLARMDRNHLRELLRRHDLDIRED